MFRIQYLPLAALDIEEIEDSLAQFSLSAADKFSEAIEGQMANLVKFPYIYPVSAYDKDLRSMSLPYKYILFYHVDEPAELIRIYRVLHGMRDIPSIL